MYITLYYIITLHYILHYLTVFTVLQGINIFTKGRIIGCCWRKTYTTDCHTSINTRALKDIHQIKIRVAACLRMFCTLI